MDDPEFMPAVPVDSIAPGQAVAVAIAGRSILICNSAGTVFAIENRCTHAEEPLACGRIRNGWIACPAHGARFDLETGEALSPPASIPVQTFRVRIVNAMIEVAV